MTISRFRLGLALAAILVAASLLLLQIGSATSATTRRAGSSPGRVESRLSSSVAKKPRARIEASIASASLTAAQARKVKLHYLFSRSSKTFTYRLERGTTVKLLTRASTKWSMVRSVRRKGNFKGVNTRTVHKFFGPRAIKPGNYRLRLFADGNHATISFKIIETIPLTKVAAVSAGGYMGCALLSGGTVDCWGFDGEGQLGDGRMLDVPPFGISTAIPVLRLSNATALSAGSRHTCVLLGGAVQCWGFNGGGQLGNGGFADSSVPVAVAGLTNAVSVASGGYHSCALVTDGTVDCWGYNRQGQLGNGDWVERAAVPAPVVGLIDVVSISAGGSHTCALLSDHTIKCWGDNWVGEIGDGATGWRLTPVQVNNITNALQVSAGGYHTCALLIGGTVSCWGFNLFGQLGNRTWADSKVPVAVPNLKGVVSISAGGFHTCALLDTGAISCWGQNDYGQLGNGRIKYSNTPVAVKGIRNAIAVSAGLANSCALLNSGRVKCWGYNEVGGLGDGTTLDSSVPVGVSVLK